MKHLRENNLYFGDMMEVSSPHLITRYNAALAGFGLSPTKLNSFQIDMTGYSPEVAEELGDPDYLDPKSINRRFIILSPEQMSLPVVHTAFSNTGQLMHQFFDANARALNSLTIKDVVFGEIEDSVFEAKDIEDLLSIEDVEFKVYTGDNLSQKAIELRALVDRLTKDPEAWRNDKMLQRMVSLARSCGDIRSNDIVPDEIVFRHSAFWTELFGGLYIFIDGEQTTVIGNRDAPGFRRSRPWQVSYIDADDQEQIYKFLLDTGRVDPPRGSWIERSGIIEHRMDALVAKFAFHIEPKLIIKPGNRLWRESWISANASFVEDEGTLPFLNWAKRELSSWSSIDLDEIDVRGRFILSRARPAHPDQWLVNRLISDHVSFDHLTRFIFAKPSFYKNYREWPKNYRQFVAEEIRDTYLPDKAALRARLFEI